MRKFLLQALAKAPNGVQKFVAQRGLDYIFTKLVRIEFEGKENLPDKDETVLFVCNHLSNIDGPTLNRVIGDYKPTFVAGQKLTDDPFTGLFKKVFKSINIKPNSPDKAAMKQIINLLKSGQNVVIFPEGTRSRTGSMIEGKKGILLIARLANVRIVPLAMAGSEKILPIAKDGNMTGEKIHKGTIKVKAGKPFSLPAKTEEQTKEEYEQRSMEYIMRQISVMLPEDYRGVYQ